MIVGVQAAQLARRYQLRLLGLADRAEFTVSKVWDDLGSWDEADIERFAAAAAPIVTGAQRSGAALAVGYLQLLTGSPHAVDIAALAGSTDFKGPFIGYWAALARGETWETAIDSGRTRAGSLAVDGVHTAAREASTVIDKAEQRIVGWERMLSGLACEWCTTVATARYRTAESASFGHERCDCIPTPIFAK